VRIKCLCLVEMHVSKVHYSRERAQPSRPHPIFFKSNFYLQKKQKLQCMPMRTQIAQKCIKVNKQVIKNTVMAHIGI